MRIAYITNASPHSGIGYRAHHLRQALVQYSELKISDIAFDPDHLPFHPWPGVLGSKSVNWIRWGQQLKPEPADLYDLTNQTLSFLAKRLQPSILTVHDIIEILEPQDKRAALLNRYLYSGIVKARHLIAVSEYTKKTIIKHYSVPSSRITVIHNGVGEEFHSIENFRSTIGYQQLQQDLKLGDAHPIILYVGSDHPRKNVPIALELFAQLKQTRPDAVFLKVGEAGILAGRAATLETIDRLNIRDAVRFIGAVLDDHLNMLYNLADVLIFPSRFEGFGLPPLQAMAAGLPVVCSNATSIPEVVGDAAFTHNPDDVAGMLASVRQLTEDRQTHREFSRRGIARAKKFSWEKAAEQVIGVYKKATS